MEEPSTEKAPRRLRRVGYLAAALVLIPLLLLAVAFVAAHQLHRPWAKQRVQRLVRESAQYELDYADVTLRLFSGLELEGLSVRSAPDPNGVREVEAEVGKLRVRWSLRELVAAEHRVQAIAVERSRVVLSSSEAAPARPAEETKPTPLSQLPGKFLRKALPADHVEVTSLTFESRRFHSGAVQESFIVEGLAVTLDAAPVSDGWSVRAQAGTSREPLTVHVRRDGPRADAARLQVHVTADATPSTATAALDVRVLEQNLVPEVSLQDALHLEAKAQFDAAAAKTRLALHSLRLADGAADVQGDLVVPDGSGPLEISSANADVDLLRLIRASPPGLIPATVASGSLHLRARELTLAGTEVVRGSLSLNAEATSLALSKPSLSVAKAALQLDLSPSAGSGARMLSDLGVNGSGSLKVSELVVAGKKPLRIPDARVELKATDVIVDTAHAERGSGQLKLVAELGTTRANAEVTKRAENVDYAFDLQAPRLAALRPYVPVAFARRVGWSSAASLRAKGQLVLRENARPTLHQDLSLEWQRPQLDNVAAQKLVLALKLDGDVMRGGTDADLRVEGLKLEERALGTARIKAAVKLDRIAKKLNLDINAVEGPQISLAGALSFKRPQQAVRVDLDGKLSALGPLKPLLPMAGLEPLGLDTFDASLSLHGDLLGTVADVKEDTVVLAREPERTAAFEGTMEGRVAGFHWKKSEGAETRVDALSLRATLGKSADRRTARAHLEAGVVRLNGEDEIELQGVSSDLDVAAAGLLAEGVFDLNQKLHVRALRQDAAPYYPLGEVTLDVSARRNANGVIRLSKLTFDNALAGTHLQLSGAVDWSDLRRRFSLDGELEQDLARVSTTPELFAGKGKLGLVMRVESPNMTLFRTKGTLRFERADLRLARKGISVESLEGQVPFVTDFSMKKGELSVVKKREVNAYSLLRFADQHPLQSTSSYLRATRITTPMVTVAPLAANLRIDQRAISLSQLELGVRGGRVSGQCLLDWDGADSSLQARVRATGVQSSHGEPFDGNAAIAVSMRERSIDGRADVLRIGNRHLLDLLDLQDPHRTDASINRMRSALALGYPQNMRVTFNRGFATVNVSFGGLARFVSVDELHGIPVGPLLDRALAKTARTMRKP